MPSNETTALKTDGKDGLRQQYAALCYRHIGKKKNFEVLLITSRDTGRWVTPKGWPMANKAPHEVAEQEAFEEAGIKGDISQKSIGNFHYLKRLNDGSSVPCNVELFPLRVRKTKSKFPEAAERVLKWATLKEAVDMVDEEELKSLLLDFAIQMNE